MSINVSLQIIKAVINKRKHNAVCTKFKCNDITITDGNDIANSFNNFLLILVLHLLKIFLCLLKKHLIICRTMFWNCFICPLLLKQKLTKSYQISKIVLQASIIKTVKDSIKIPLAHIGNLSFDTGIFPVELKIAQIVNIFKSGDECIFTNYRPVSVLPVFSKIMERLMHDRLISYMLKHSILFEYQFGFQKGKSTHMALITLELSVLWSQVSQNPGTGWPTDGQAEGLRQKRLRFLRHSGSASPCLI